MKKTILIHPNRLRWFWRLLLGGCDLVCPQNENGPAAGLRNNHRQLRSRLPRKLAERSLKSRPAKARPSNRETCSSGSMTRSYTPSAARLRRESKSPRPTWI